MICLSCELDGPLPEPSAKFEENPLLAILNRQVRVFFPSFPSHLARTSPHCRVKFRTESKLQGPDRSASTVTGSRKLDYTHPY